MGQTAQHIVKHDINEIIQLLNQAYAEEWLAYYQYWIGAKVASGFQRASITEEFVEHANEELKHANWLADRIIQLGGTPVLHPNKWEEFAKCRYEAPEDPCIHKILEQNLTAEKCAVGHYQKLCEITHNVDFATFRLVEKILREEIEHEQEIEDFINDIKISHKALAEN